MSMSLTLRDTIDMDRDKVREAFWQMKPEDRLRLQAEIRGLGDITVTQALFLLGFKYSFDTIMRWMKPKRTERFLFSSKPGGGTIIIKVKDLEDFLAQSYTGNADYLDAEE